MPTSTEERIEAALLRLPRRSRARVAANILKSLRGDGEPDAGWIEELEWRLQDWRTGVRLDAIDDLLDDPRSASIRTSTKREKSFDAVRMMREIRERMSREMEGMSPDEQLAYIGEGVRRSREQRRAENTPNQ